MTDLRTGPCQMENRSLYDLVQFQNMTVDTQQDFLSTVSRNPDVPFHYLSF